MRSLPPPRTTRKRRWKRFQRALKSLLFRGQVSDPGAFFWRRKKPNKVTRRHWNSGEHFNSGVRAASVAGRLVRRASAPFIRSVKRPASSVNMTVKF
ncbi:hypothetical protein CAAN1_01S11012 [[Candida] anglica]|uniref:Uncharacterized protein n=1 Tax=[Candida] anglica TaxID=148631 RepID=A0ABP0EKB1_9ASCO